MAGFFGLFDYSKPGKGVRKDEPQKPRFFHFWELFFRKFWKLIQLNLLFVLFCIPVVTIGPATAGMTYVLRNMANEQPIFLFSDFWDAFKANWKQSFLYSLLLAVCLLAAIVSGQFYLANAASRQWLLFPAAVTFFICLMLLMMNYYVMLMIVTLDLPLGSIIKNALILAIVRLKTNLLTLLFTGAILLATWLFFPYTILLVLLIVPAWIGFIICFNSYPGIQKHVIDPFVEAPSQQDSDREALFQDEEDPAP